MLEEIMSNQEIQQIIFYWNEYNELISLIIGLIFGYIMVFHLGIE
jgi:hypothetical protein